jgi:arginine decarboxylase
LQEHAYTVLLAEPEFRPGEATWAIAGQLAERGLTVIPARDTGDVARAIGADTSIGAALLGWELFSSEREFHAVVDDLPGRQARPPLVLLSGQPGEDQVPPAAAGRADRYFWLPADSPRFVAGQVERLVQAHAERLMTQFLAELTGCSAATDWISYLPGPDGALAAAAAGDASCCLAMPPPARDAAPDTAQAR